jgi:hypothetical protein
MVTTYTLTSKITFKNSAEILVFFVQHTRAPDDEKTRHIMIENAHQRIELFKSAFGESVKSFTEHLER